MKTHLIIHADVVITSIYLIYSKHIIRNEFKADLKVTKWKKQMFLENRDFGYWLYQYPTQIKKTKIDSKKTFHIYIINEKKNQRVTIFNSKITIQLNMKKSWTYFPFDRESNIKQTF